MTKRFSAQRLKKARKDAGYNLALAASSLKSKGCKISAAGIHAHEDPDNDVTPKFDLILGYSELYNVPLDYFAEQFSTKKNASLKTSQKKKGQ